MYLMAVEITPAHTDGTLARLPGPPKTHTQTTAAPQTDRDSITHLCAGVVAGLLANVHHASATAHQGQDVV